MFVFGAVAVLMVGCQPFRWVVSATKRCRGSLASFRSIVSERRLEVLCNWCFFPKLWFFFMDLLNWRILFPTKVTFITEFRSRNLNHLFTYNKATEIAANSNNVPSRAILSWLFVQCVTIQGKIQAYINDWFLRCWPLFIYMTMSHWASIKAVRLGFIAWNTNLSWFEVICLFLKISGKR